MNAVIKSVQFVTICGLWGSEHSCPCETMMYRWAGVAVFWKNLCAINFKVQQAETPRRRTKQLTQEQWLTSQKIWD